MSIDGIRFKVRGDELLSWLEAERLVFAQDVTKMTDLLQELEYLDWTGDINKAEKTLQTAQDQAQGIMGLLTGPKQFNLAKAPAKRKEECSLHFQGALEIAKQRVEHQDWKIAHISPGDTFLLTDAEFERTYFRRNDAFNALKAKAAESYSLYA